MLRAYHEMCISFCRCAWLQHKDYHFVCNLQIMQSYGTCMPTPWPSNGWKLVRTAHVQLNELEFSTACAELGKNGYYHDCQSKQSNKGYCGKWEAARRSFLAHPQNRTAWCHLQIQHVRIVMSQTKYDVHLARQQFCSRKAVMTWYACKIARPHTLACNVLFTSDSHNNSQYIHHPREQRCSHPHWCSQRCHLNLGTCHLQRLHCLV